MIHALWYSSFLLCISRRWVSSSFLRNKNVTQEERKFDGFNQIQHESNQIFMNACTISNAQERLRYTTFSIPYKLPAEKKNSEDTYLYTWIENAKPIWNHFLLDSLWCACILCGNKGSVLNYGYNKGYRVSVGLSIEFSILCASLWRQSSSVKE